ncbi:MAG: DNA repair protein RadA [Candidatus Muproteobacteria bacterium RBG_16_62_13]|uniref:DNA repair protein RadA n=1 Tax=Candidatus Muproteobacteria bacterium RBG_16_62_13 TaxID=1817756 RepID=A0A1F6T2N3_9PROT|nr:MAG: DNA repair protein RadA [Candidatus Muproteobacteria bacterium RBG_16_62_13]
MAKAKTAYVCTECGASSPKWVGQCPSCNAWNSLTESVVAAASASRVARLVPATNTKASPLSHIEAEKISRRRTGIGEFDRVLGGGLVAGSVVLIGGDPGIGKSTLLIQALSELGREADVLYVSGEESADQIALRAQRLGLSRTAGERLKLFTENRLEAILASVQTENPAVVVIDSIQTVYTDMLQSAPGSVAQVRETAAQLVRYAKHSGTSLFLVGHVTKEGAIAGPRVLEHMVDTVLYFEGETDNRYRILRAIKNRFGAVNEIGVFVMTELGLREVSNPSAMFLSRQGDAVPGSLVLATQEGTRPLLVEVQALVDQSHLSNPRRVCVGLDATRLAMLLAVLHRHAGIVTFDQDVFVNVVGGVRVTETAADLAVLSAVVSSLRNRPLGRDLAVFGEVGLAGEVRPVGRGQERIREAAKLGFKRMILPAANLPKEKDSEIALVPVRRLDDALEELFSG